MLSSLGMFTFHIDKEKSETFRTFTVRLDRALDEKALVSSASAKEVPLIQRLIAEEKSFLQRENKRVQANHLFAHFRISAKSIRPLLQMMASVGKVSFNSKQLACDFFNPLIFAFSCTTKDDSFDVVSHVCDASHSWPLTSCDFLFLQNPPFVIKGSLLRFIDFEAYDSDFLKLVTPSKTYTRKEYESWLKAIQESDVAEEFRKITSNATHAAASEPLPVLFVADHTFAFATLMMDYEGEIRPFTGQNTELVFEKDLLECGFQKKQIAHSHYYCPVDKAHKAIDFLLDCGWRVLDHKKRELKRLSHLEYTLSQEREYLVIEGKAQFGTDEVDTKTLFDALKKKQSLVDLGNNQSGLLPLFKDDERLAAFLGLAQEIEIISDKAKIKKVYLGLLEDGEQKRIFNQNETRTISTSSSFQGTLYGYQEEGVKWLQFLYQNGFSGILADDMGLGKTVQVLAFLSTIEAKKPTLIVIPASLQFNWRREIERFLPHARLGVDIILTTYGHLRERIDSLEKTAFGAVILDEAQNIKNSTSKAFGAALRLQADFRLSISGTPIENSHLELFSQFQFLLPTLLDEKDPLALIKKKIRPFILRRKKEEVAKDLPEKIVQTLFVEMDGAQKLIYERTHASFKAHLLQKISLDGTGTHSMEILEAILRLRQIACHPELTPQLILEGDTLSSSKFEQVLSDLETIIEEKKKVIVFSQFSSMLKLFAKKAKERSWAFGLLDGEVPTGERERIVDEFQTKDDLLLFLCSLKAGGVGLNLTKADYVILYDPWWNEAAELQAENRAHRIGRQGSVIVKRYVTLDSIEEKVVELQRQKRALISALLDNEDTNEIGSHFSLDELKALLN